MVNLFDKLYSTTTGQNEILNKLRIYSCFRVVLRVIANLMLPIYFRFTKYNNKYKLNAKSCSKAEKRIIVSLTSFPNRINRLWLVIESILHQSVKPDMIILWLSSEQFSDMNKLPRNLLNLVGRGLDIRFVDGNLRSHKKYYYAIKEFPDDFIITVDDDVFYNTRIVETLIEQNRKYPEAICCNMASIITIDSSGDIMPYIQWKDVFDEQLPNYELIPIGVGGVIYPPFSLCSEVLNFKIFEKHCLYADDIWLNMMSRMQNTRVSKSQYNSLYLPVISVNNKSLNSINVDDGLNDLQLEAVRNYCIQSLGYDPFFNLIFGEKA